MPLAPTATVGVNAPRLFGVRLALTGALQCRPPSVDIEMAMLSCVPLNWESCQTTYRLPFVWSTAISGMIAPSRTEPGVFGSGVPTLTSGLTSIGAYQVAPWSVERRTTISLAFVL